MNDPIPHPNARRRMALKLKAAAVIFAIGLACFVLFAHSFLALNQPVAADVMIVEGWVPDYVLAGAAHEFKAGHYNRIFISGIELEPGELNFTQGSDAAEAGRRLVTLGINPALIEPCPTPPVSFNRTSHMARTVRDRIRSLGVNPRGVNVVNLGPHGRQSLLAYQRMLGKKTLVGIITIPKDDYNPARWWASNAGINKTVKDFAGWLKEVIFGLRS